VAAAKRQVFGAVGIDIIAGPSEVLIIADGTAPEEWMALDLFSQAEHDAAAQAILVCPDSNYLDAVSAAMARLLPERPRAAVIRASLEGRGALVQTRNLDEAVALANRIAPEHLELAVDDPDALLGNIRHAGAIFVGPHSPEVDPQSGGSLREPDLSGQQVRADSLHPASRDPLAPGNDARLLEHLPQRGHRGRPLGLTQFVRQEVQSSVRPVGLVDHASREHVRSGGESRRVGALQEEHLEQGIARWLPRHDDRGRGSRYGRRLTGRDVAPRELFPLDALRGAPQVAQAARAGMATRKAEPLPIVTAERAPAGPAAAGPLRPGSS